MPFKNCKRMVIKVGSVLLVDPIKQKINLSWLSSLVDDVVTLLKQGIEVIVVSSGSIAIGKQMLGIGSECTLDKQQAAAAVGQIQLAHTYQALLKQRGFSAAQLLLTLDDSENRRRYLNIRNTLLSLLSLKAVPIINENDTVTTDEIRYGDNDRLAARVAQMVQADVLVLLSDIDGFYTADPNLDANAKLVPEVTELSPEVLAMAGESFTSYGSGGMKTKLAAANIAMSSGCRLLITAGRHLHPIAHYLKLQKGTWFIPQTTPMSAKKIWLKDHLQLKGKIVVDAGASVALMHDKSLLPVGIVNCQGDFQKGDPVAVIDESQQVIAHGFSNYSKHDVMQIKGHSSVDITDLLGYCGSHEVVHRDNLVLLKEE